MKIEDLNNKLIILKGVDNNHLGFVQFIPAILGGAAAIGNVIYGIVQGQQQQKFQQQLAQQQLQIQQQLEKEKMNMIIKLAIIIAIIITLTIILKGRGKKNEDRK